MSFSSHRLARAHSDFRGGKARDLLFITRGRSRRNPLGVCRLLSRPCLKVDGSRKPGRHRRIHRFQAGISRTTTPRPWLFPYPPTTRITQEGAQTLCFWHRVRCSSYFAGRLIWRIGSSADPSPPPLITLSFSSSPLTESRIMATLGSSEAAPFASGWRRA